MKKFTYPAVIFYDEDEKKYILSLYDMGIIEEGDSVEDVHKKCIDSLSMFLSCAKVFSSDVPTASTFDEVVKKYPKNQCILVEAIA